MLRGGRSLEGHRDMHVSRRYSDCCCDLLLLQEVSFSSWCRTALGLMCAGCEGSSWRMLMPVVGPLVLLT